MTDRTEQLKRHLYILMMDSMETLSQSAIIGAAIEVESSEGCQFTPEEIRIANTEATEEMVDAYVENERDTRTASGITPEEIAESEARESTFEAMRPRNVRRQQLAEILSEQSKGDLLKELDLVDEQTSELKKRGKDLCALLVANHSPHRVGDVVDDKRGGRILLTYVRALPHSAHGAIWEFEGRKLRKCGTAGARIERVISRI